MTTPTDRETTASKRIPALFSGAMIRAIRREVAPKTMTRRTSDKWAKARPGDVLWTRETWGPCAGGIVYRADDVGGTVRSPDGGKWRPSIFMPSWASRNDLEIVSIRRERVQDISDADIAAEGVDAEAVEALWNAATRKRRREVNEAFGYGPDHAGAVVGSSTRPRDLWRIAWTLITGAKSWDENGFVWAIQFARVGGR